jgi:SNF2 family DNA or RNA helicase
MVEQQAFERCHRLGQASRVTVHRLYVSDTVEQSLVALQERKRALAASTLTGDLAAFNKMDLEDLKMLFGHKSGGAGAAAGIAAMATAAAGAAAGARRG